MSELTSVSGGTVTQDVSLTVVAPYPPIDGTQPCDGATPLFFPADPLTRVAVPRAVALCRRCPFLADCLAYALTTDVYGVWGGTTHDERRELRRRYGIQARPVHDLTASRLASWEVKSA